MGYREPVGLKTLELGFISPRAGPIFAMHHPVFLLVFSAKFDAFWGARATAGRGRYR
jgi:hypothetical protein